MLLSMSNNTRKLLLFWSVSRHSPLVTRDLFLAAALLLLSAPCAFSLDPSLDISQYAHTAWRIHDGFVRGPIDAMAQTPDGYLWLGTELGLYRFDGVRAVPWELVSGQRLPSNQIRALLAARDGALYIGTDKGLARWKDGKLTNYPEVAGSIIGSFLEDREGTVWFGAFTPGRLCSFRGGKIECYGAGSFGIGIIALYEDNRGNLWVSANGLWRWKPGAPEHYAFPSGVVEANSLVEREDVLLLATNQGIKQLAGGKIQSYALPGRNGQFRPDFFLRSRDGSLWIGTLQGLFHFHEGKTDVFAASDGLSGDFVSGLFEDREGNVWAGTTDGLDRFREYAITRISQKQGLSNSFIWSVQATADGSTWLASASGLNRWTNQHMVVYKTRTGRGGSSRLDKAGAGQTEITNGELPSAPRSLGLDEHERLFVSTAEGLFYFEGGHFTRIPGVPAGDKFAQDGHNNLWISHRDLGLVDVKSGDIAQPIPWSRFGQKKDFGPSALLPDRSRGGVWLAFYEGGIAYFNEGQVRTSYASADGLGTGHVNDLRFGSRGSLWAGTEGGLSRIRDGHVSTLTNKNGLPCDEVYWSMEDDDHFVWLYQPCGLVRLARSELDAWVSDPKHTVRATVFDASDGVRTMGQISGYSPRVTKSPDGRIWFMSWEGAGIIDPRHLPYNELPPPVHVEKITAAGKVYDAANGVRLPALVRDLTIDYTALSLVVPEKVHFRFKLEGQDKDWREVVNDRQVQYSNLAPKHYRFLVKACNNSGVWNEEGAALDFVIPPAWYQTNWFVALCVVAFLALLWALYQYRLHQLAQQFNMRLEERVGERTRIARDLHDTLLQSFHGVLLYFQTGINLLPERPAEPRIAEARKTLEKAAHQAKQAIVEGREAIQGLRSSVIEKNDLAVAMRTLGEELAANANSTAFQVHVEGTPRDLHPILRDEVYRITGEGIRNAFLHADAKQIEVEIRYDERQLRLRVRDDGKGIDPKLLGDDGRQGHFGLRGMRERAKLIGGKLTLWSEMDAGTEVELSIPAARAYTPPSEGQPMRLTDKIFAKLSGRGTAKKS